MSEKRFETANMQSKKEPPEERAKKVVAASQVRRTQTCGQRIQAILEEMQCRLDIVVILRENQVSPQMSIVPVEGWGEGAAELLRGIP